MSDWTDKQKRAFWAENRESRKREAAAPRVWIVFVDAEKGEMVTAIFSSADKRDDWLTAARTYQAKRSAYVREKYVSRSYSVDSLLPLKLTRPLT